MRGRPYYHHSPVEPHHLTFPHTRRRSRRCWQETLRTKKIDPLLISPSTGLELNSRGDDCGLLIIRTDALVDLAAKGRNVFLLSRPRKIPLSRFLGQRLLQTEGREHSAMFDLNEGGINFVCVVLIHCEEIEAQGCGSSGFCHWFAGRVSPLHICASAPLRNSARYMSGSSGRSLSQHSSAGRSSAKIPRSPM